MGSMQTLYGGMVMLGCFVLPLLAGTWILAPLDEAARHRRAKVQFMMIDFLGLMFMLTLPMGLIRMGFRPEAGNFRGEDNLMITLFMLAWGASALVWWKSVSVFSQAGIEEARERGLLVFFALPMAFVATFATAAIPLLLALDGQGRAWHWWILLEIVLLVGIVKSAYVSRKIASKAMAKTKDVVHERGTLRTFAKVIRQD